MLEDGKGGTKEKKRKRVARRLLEQRKPRSREKGAETRIMAMSPSQMMEMIPSFAM
jgi:hypothetical protein